MGCGVGGGTATSQFSGGRELLPVKVFSLFMCHNSGERLGIPDA